MPTSGQRRGESVLGYNFRLARKPAPGAHMREAGLGFIAVFSDFKSDLCAIPLGPAGSQDRICSFGPCRVVR